MALSVGVAHPGTLSIGNATPLNITSVGVAHPAPLTNNVKPAAIPVSPVSSGGGVSYGGSGGGGSYAPAPVYAPALNVNGLFSQAQGIAAGNVNPYYTKSLNDFITQQGQAKALQQQQTATDIQNLKDTLAQTQEQNATSGTRATQDTALAEQQLAQTADQRQQDQGSAFDISRNQEAQKEAQSGLSGSGLAQGAQAGAQLGQDTTEQRQAQADQQTKAASELAKARTFEDLATSNKYAGTTETKGETQANFDLSKFIQGQASDLQNESQSLEQQRLQRLATETQNQAKILFNNYIAGISNPAQRQAALSTYGGSF